MIQKIDLYIFIILIFFRDKLLLLLRVPELYSRVLIICIFVALELLLLLFLRQEPQTIYTNNHTL